MPSDEQTEKTGYLTGQLLIAMPSMKDPRFERTVMYMCVHNFDGAMGLVINRRLDEIIFPELLHHLDLKPDVYSDGSLENIPVHYGGPVESSRGFVLHTREYEKPDTIVVNDDVALTASLEILKDLAERQGPVKSLLALGYAGWAAGQLDGEIQQNAWLHAPSDETILFDTALDEKWDHAISKIGVDASLLSGDFGHA
ncbi:MAG: YqgE/AlgH family protein [Alphaproteobacteria bacterium]|nr:YqgE/AlgH family protein [Alphaproteobacteria bacterium]